jgi:translation initiation factor 6
MQDTQSTETKSFPISFSDVFGDPNVGVFSYANEKVAILPAGVSGKKLKAYRDTLGVEPYSIGIAESRLVGIYLAGNSNGLLAPHITAEVELQRLTATGLPVRVIDDRYTALGNLIVCNDYGAIVDPRLRSTTVEQIEKTLGVPAVRTTIAGLPNVGALTVASNRGALISPMANDAERKVFSNGLGVPVETGTVNSGVPFPKAGVVANSKGAIVGALTIGRELIAVSNVFEGD